VKASLLNWKQILMIANFWTSFNLPLFSRNSFIRLWKMYNEITRPRFQDAAQEAIRVNNPNLSWLICDGMKQQFKVFKKANVCIKLQICITKHQWCVVGSRSSQHFQFLPLLFLLEWRLNWKDFLIFLIYGSSLRIVIVLNRTEWDHKKTQKDLSKFFLSTWRQPLILLLCFCVYTNSDKNIISFLRVTGSKSGFS
jgi:hypothetical protein